MASELSLGNYFFMPLPHLHSLNDLIFSSKDERRSVSNLRLRGLASLNFMDYGEIIGITGISSTDFGIQHVQSLITIIRHSFQWEQDIGHVDSQTGQA